VAFSNIAPHYTRRLRKWIIDRNPDIYPLPSAAGADSGWSK